MKRLASTAVLAGIVAICMGGIQLLQDPRAVALRKVKVSTDMTTLPPPRQLRLMTFGYRAAAADLLWAALLVEHGVHSAEKRPFSGVSRYLDGILELEADNPNVYRFVDTLLIYKPGEPATAADARASRMYLERGTKERPYDHEVWMHYGQFIAFLAPTLLTDEAEIQQWRKDGAFALAHAVELGADADRSLTASSLLGKSGEIAAAVEHLQRAYALTDNPDTRLQILLKLQRFGARSDVETRVGRVEHEWQTRYPFLTRTGALLIGPSSNAALCAGPTASGTKACASDWSTATRGD